MKLTPIQVAIVAIQVTAISMNLFTIFITQVDDYMRHWINIVLITAMMILTFAASSEGRKIQRR
ncbi:hypothetical protein BHU72_01780 [Desulfuribacillus stibiiarsenatis]|uniref:Uncharacterized protein n=1 Tax=Desulfuribacillus stibiiarsenatis TaxID=1390249 RepID=A0A1E5LA56_9FIRM|nr:hypothetical protein [Desulfuribacillus stibiiarsenatis]OEH87010.1 hypothetical protein BHU72_01780 [Desulfuribacillus stibiiarsenatis]